MIRTTIATILLAALLGAGAAQAEGYWGFQGGINFADMGGDTADFGDVLADQATDATGEIWTDAKKGRRGFIGGLTYARMYKPSIGFEIDLMYASRGVRFDLATGGRQAEVNYRFNYVEIPLMLRWAPAHGHQKQIILMFGPTLSFLSGPSVTLSGINVPEAEDDIDDATGTLFGLTTVAQFRLSVNESMALQVQGRFYKGITNAIDHTDFESTSQDFSVLAGLEFAFGE